jgi:GPH family glycoside/pentoside/hexuronide:cation symporter
MIAAAFGTFSISALGFPIVLYFGGGEESLGFIYAGLIAGAMAAIILTITVSFVRERSFNKPKELLPSFKEVMASVASNYPFWIVFSAILILISTFLMFNNNLIYFAKYALDMHEQQGLILGMLNGVTLLAVPFWAFTALKLGKRNTWLLAMTLLFIGFCIFYIYPISTLHELLYILAFIGLGNGATGVLFWSMLPDTIEYGEWKSGIRTESSLYGFMTFAQKGAIAVAVIILGIALTKIGFVANQDQSAETLKGLKSLMSLIPLVGIFISFILIYFYPIDRALHQKLITEIQQRGEIND